MARTASAMVIPDKAALSTALGEFCAGAYTSSEISAWDVSAVTDMAQLIYNAPCKSTFNNDLNAWDVGKVTNTGVRLDLGGAAPTHRTARAHAPD